MNLRRLACCAATTALVAACAAESSSNKSVSPAGSSGDFPQSIGAAREELEKSAHEVDLSSGDCQAACKALASLERAANHLCMVAEPEECTDARARLDRARRQVTAQCGTC